MGYSIYLVANILSDLLPLDQNLNFILQLEIILRVMALMILVKSIVPLLVASIHGDLHWLRPTKIYLTLNLQEALGAGSREESMSIELTRWHPHP